MFLVLLSSIIAFAVGLAEEEEKVNQEEEQQHQIDHHEFPRALRGMWGDSNEDGGGVINGRHGHHGHGHGWGGGDSDNGVMV